MGYALSIKKDAQKYIKKQDAPTIRRLMNAIDDICADPSIGEHLTNHDDAEYKYRVGSYRILYNIYETEIMVEVIKVGARGDVYK